MKLRCCKGHFASVLLTCSHGSYCQHCAWKHVKRHYDCRLLLRVLIYDIFPRVGRCEVAN